jgi:hypothetical protein
MDSKRNSKTGLQWIILLYIDANNIKPLLCEKNWTLVMDSDERFGK